VFAIVLFKFSFDVKFVFDSLYLYVFCVLMATQVANLVPSSRGVKQNEFFD
jgi:hypothetical protein